MFAPSTQPPYGRDAQSEQRAAIIQWRTGLTVLARRARNFRAKRIRELLWLKRTTTAISPTMPVFKDSTLPGSFREIATGVCERMAREVAKRVTPVRG